MRKSIALVLFIGCAACAATAFGHDADPEARPVPKVIRLDSGGRDYLRVLGGPPETSTMHSGLVTLAPGKSVGKHSTKKYEEVLVVFEGRGVMEIAGGPALRFAKGEVLYCPPQTEHNVTNIGEGRLMYLYIVAEAKP